MGYQRREFQDTEYVLSYFGKGAEEKKYLKFWKKDQDRTEAGVGWWRFDTVCGRLVGCVGIVEAGRAAIISCADIGGW
jgi:hypothetical protein